MDFKLPLNYKTQLIRFHLVLKCFFPFWDFRSAANHIKYTCEEKSIQPLLYNLTTKRGKGYRNKLFQFVGNRQQTR